MNFRGINHLAMVTNDMDKTIRFYRDVLGMPLVAALGSTPEQQRYRHYFFETGPNSTIAFFEWPGMEEEFHKPAGMPVGGRVQFDHISFDVESEEALLELQDKLAKAWCGSNPISRPQVDSFHLLHRPQRHRPRGFGLDHQSYWPPTGLCRPLRLSGPGPCPSIKRGDGTSPAHRDQLT